MARDPQCIFCKIISAEIPASVVYEDDRALAFLDIGPLAEGHVLVIPRNHYSRVSQFPADEFASVASVIPRLIKVISSETKCEGVNILLNDGSVAGQVVHHTHFHLIPRKPGDGLGYRWNPGKYPDGRAAEIAASLRQALMKHS